MHTKLAIFVLMVLFFIPLAGYADDRDRSSGYESDTPSDYRPANTNRYAPSGSGMATIYLFRPSRFYSRWATPTIDVNGPGFRCYVRLRNKRYVRFQVTPSYSGAYRIYVPRSYNWQFRSGGISLNITRAGTYYVGLLPSGTDYRMAHVSTSEAQRYLRKLKLAGNKRNTCR